MVNWFPSRRFGMFIHWGIYSLSGFHEQYRFVTHQKKEEYEALAGVFNPVRFDADRVVSLAREAGMRYICFTAKHHDGFCMWDTDQTDYKITNTPFGRDVLAELAAACERQGMALSIYYSIPDWHNPDAYNPASSHQIPPPEGVSADYGRYIVYVKKQITELLTRYGKIWSLFWDIPPQIRDESVNLLARSLQPDIMINDRGFSEGDYQTPERSVPDGKSFARPTEGCQSVGRMSWGYRENEDYFAARMLTRDMDNLLARGGNYLLNVGPKPDGTIPEKAEGLVRTVGDWYGRVREAFDSAEPCHAVLGRDENPLTFRGNLLYVHFPDIPICSGLAFNQISVLPRSCTLLNDGRRIETALERFPTWVRYDDSTPPCLHIKNIPVDEFSHEPLVLRLEFDSPDDFLTGVEKKI